MASQLTTSINSENASLIVVLPDGRREEYRLEKVPPATSTLVLAAKQEILNDLDMNAMLASLSHVSDLLYLAYCGVAGTKTIWAGLADRRKTFLDLCGDCVITMNLFQSSANTVVSNLAEAFHWILNGQEKRALGPFARAATKATAMAASSKALAERFSALGNDVQKDHHDTLEAVASEVGELAELRRREEEMQALFESQRQRNEELATSIQSLQGLYEDAKSREEKASERAFIAGIIGSVTNALGSAFGAYMAAKNPVGSAVTAFTGGKGNGDGGEEAPEKGKGEKGSKESGSEAGAAAAEAGAKELGKGADKMAGEAQRASESLREEKMRLLDEKLKQEAEKREAVSKMAELTSRLSSSQTEQKIHESAQAALEIAVWALANVVTTLVLSSHFWKNVAAACERLGESEVKDRIQEELDSGEDAQARRDYYLSEYFLPGAIVFLSRWAALVAISGEYREKAAAARDTTIKNIDASPKIDEARQLLEPLKKKIAAYLAEESAASEQRSATVRDELAILQDLTLGG